MSKIHRIYRRASIYVRLSREADAENLSRDGMIAECRAVAAREGLEVVAVHLDDGISGAVRNRPEFLRWLADGREGRADVLIAWHADRMTREGVNVAALILDVVEGKDSETGKVVRPPVRLMDTKGLDSEGDTSAFRFRFVIAAEVARGERERMADRAKASHRRARSAGRWTGGTVPFGFRAEANPDGGGKVLVIEPREAKFVREAAERLLAGESLSSVVRWANRPGNPKPRRADGWRRITLAKVLTGGPVGGRIVTVARDGHGNPVGEPFPVLDADGRPVTCPAILTADESAAMRRILAPRPAEEKKGGRAPSRLLSKVIVCHQCGSPLRVSTRGKNAAYYRCMANYEGRACARPVAVSAISAEQYVEEEFLRRKGELPSYTRRAVVTGEAAVEIAEAEHSAALAALAENATAENFARLQAAAQAREAVQGLPREHRVRLVPTGRTLHEEWEAGELADRRELLAANLASIVLLPGKAGNRLDPSRFLLLDQAPVPVDEPSRYAAHRLVVAPSEQQAVA